MPGMSFTPATTVSASATTSSAAGSGTLNAANTTMEINNAGTVTVFVRWGTGAQTATTSDYPVQAGHCKLVNKGQATNVAAITASGSATVYFTDGNGDI